MISVFFYQVNKLYRCRRVNV